MTNVNDLLHRAASGLGEHASDCLDCHATARDIDEYMDSMEPAASVPDGVPSSSKPYEGSLPDRIATLEAQVKRLTADKAHLEQQFMEEHERAERLTEERDAATALWNLFLDDPDNAQIKALRAALTTVTEERDEARSLLRQKIAELANDRIALAAKDDALQRLDAANVRDRDGWCPNCGRHNEHQLLLEPHKRRRRMAGVQTGPHDFTRLGGWWQWWLRDSCRACYKERFLHPITGWVESRPLHDNTKAGRWSR